MALSFDANYYLSARPDVFHAFVATAGATGKTWAEFAEEHYNTFGRFEGANPNATFNTDEYLAANPDVAAAGVNPFTHYLHFGAAEGRAPSDSFPSFASFDSAAYLAANPDLGAAGIDTAEEAYAHFVIFGQFESRPGAPAVDNGLPGSTFTLTPGADTFDGTKGNDTFNALTINAAGTAATTLSAFDKLDGGAGVDTLNIYSDGTDNKQLPTSATIKNIETINVYNDTAAFTTDGTNVVASRFEGATQIWQNGLAANVTALAATTTAGFKGVTANTAAALSVGAATSATSASVKLDGVKGNTTTNDVVLGVSGAAVNSVTIAGTIAQQTVNTTAASLALKVTGSTTATSFNLNTEVKTGLTLTGMAAVTSVDASASTGGVTFNGGTQVQTITTGAGGDTVTSAFATTASKAATISTGAGDDIINVNTTGAGLTTVDAGAGNDTINVVKVAGNKLNIQGGEGNDTVVLTGVALATTDVIDGGEGIDTISLAGSATARTDDDFIVLNSLLKNFETLKLSTAEGTNLASGLNVAKLAANYTTIDFAAASFADNVGSQNLVANGALTVEAAGYKSLTEVQVTDPAATSAVYAGSVNVTEKATGTVTVGADSVTLTVDASKAAVTGTLAGDVKTATVNLVQGVDGKGTVDTADDVLFASKVVVSNAVELTNLASLTLTGNGVAEVMNFASTKLVTIDASGLASADIAGKAVAGLTYTSGNALAETITLGAGVDTIQLNASTYGAVNAKTFDTVVGLNLVMDGAALAATSDTIKVGALTGFAKFTTAHTDLDLALKDAAIAAAGDNLVFQLGGDTYIYSDTGANGTVDSNDVLVKLAGAVDLDALVLSLG